MSHSDVATPYAAVARMRNSQHLDNNPAIGKLIGDNRHDFENLIATLADKSHAVGTRDCDELTLMVQYIEQAKDAFGRALIHGVGTCKGVPFEEAVRASQQRAPARPPAERPSTSALLQESARDFERFTNQLSDKASAHALPESPERALALQLLRQAREMHGHALAHNIPLSESFPASAHGK